MNENMNDAIKTLNIYLKGLAQIERAIIKDKTMSVHEVSVIERITLDTYREFYFDMSDDEFEKHIQKGDKN